MTLRFARRLEETTQVMHGLREFNDQLPDAIIMADKDRNILSWNQAAEKLHGRTWQQMKGYPLADLYQDSRAYEQFCGGRTGRQFIAGKRAGRQASGWE